MTILKNIPRIIPAKLLSVLARMGHGDTIVLADANFPAASVAAMTPGGLINCDGVDGVTMLRAIMTLLPLDPVASPVGVMQLMPEHKAAGWKTPIWDAYQRVIDEAEGRAVPRHEIERFEFYERAK